MLYDFFFIYYLNGLHRNRPTGCCSCRSMEKQEVTPIKWEIQWSGKFHSYDRYGHCEVWETLFLHFLPPGVQN